MFGAFLRRNFLEAFLTLSLVLAKNLGFYTLVPSDITTAVLHPKSNPIAPVLVSLTRSHLRVILAYQKPFFQTMVQVLGVPQVLALPRILMVPRLDKKNLIMFK